jgi:hypothetical protein
MVIILFIAVLSNNFSLITTAIMEVSKSNSTMAPVSAKT